MIYCNFCKNCVLITNKYLSNLLFIMITGSRMKYEMILNNIESIKIKYLELKFEIIFFDVFYNSY